MTRPRTALLVALALSAAAALAADDAAAPAKPYATDLSAMPPGPPPEEIYINNGKFAVAAEAGGNKYLELAANPLDTYGFSFGPDEVTAIEAAARVRGTSVGKLFPEFGVGANGSGGWKLWVLPGQDAVVLRKNEVDEVARAPFKWQSGTWTRLKIRVSPVGGGGDKWQIQGKAWPDGAAEPAEWTLTYKSDAAPPTGRANAWGQPYSGTPIQFDDLSATPLAAEKK